MTEPRPPSAARQDDGTVAPQDRRLRALLGLARTIAVVGLSSRPDRPSNEVAAYLQRRGYRIIPVNPFETEVLGEPAHPSLLDVSGRVDVVNVFRRPDHTPEVARQAVRIGARMLWLQVGVVNEEASRIATDGGLDVVMGLCIRTESSRLGARPREEAS